MSSLIIPGGVKTAPAEPELTDEQREALAKMAESLPEEEILPKVRTAFAIIIDRDGNVSVDPALVKGVICDSEPNNNDITAALAIIDREMQTNIAAMKSAQVMMQQAQAQMQAQMQQVQFADVQRRLQTGK